MSQDFTTSLIRIPDPDAPIFRIMRLPHLLDTLEQRSLFLSSPAGWDDPFENLLTKCAIVDKQGKQSFFDQLRWPSFGQSWSLKRESDSFWRAYSWYEREPVTGRNRHPENEGVQVRTTAGKLISALRNWSPTDHDESCFLGAVRYTDDWPQIVADEVGRLGVDAFARGVGHAESLLFKRPAFEHEQEIRLLYFDASRRSQQPHVRVPIDPNELFDDLVFDPRLPTFEWQERHDMVRGRGFGRNVTRSLLYQPVLFEIIVD